MSASPPPWWHGILGKALAMAFTFAAVAALLPAAAALYQLTGIPAHDAMDIALKMAALIVGGALIFAWIAPRK